MLKVSIFPSFRIKHVAFTHLKTVLFQHILDHKQGAESYDFFFGYGDWYTTIIGLARQWFGCVISQPRVLLHLRDRDSTFWHLVKHPLNQIAHIQRHAIQRKYERIITNNFMNGPAIRFIPGQMPCHEHVQCNSH